MFQPRINRYGQFVSVEAQEARYRQVIQELDTIYGPGETYEVVSHDYRWEGKRLVKFVVSRELVVKTDTARWHAENDY